MHVHRRRESQGPRAGACQVVSPKSRCRSGQDSQDRSIRVTALPPPNNSVKYFLNSTFLASKVPLNLSFIHSSSSAIARCNRSMASVRSAACSVGNCTISLNSSNSCGTPDLTFPIYFIWFLRRRISLSKLSGSVATAGSTTISGGFAGVPSSCFSRQRYGTWPNTGATATAEGLENQPRPRPDRPRSPDSRPRNFSPAAFGVQDGMIVGPLQFAQPRTRRRLSFFQLILEALAGEET